MSEVDNIKRFYGKLRGYYKRLSEEPGSHEAIEADADSDAFELYRLISNKKTPDYARAAYYTFSDLLELIVHHPDEASLQNLHSLPVKEGDLGNRTLAKDMIKKIDEGVQPALRQRIVRNRTKQIADVKAAREQGKAAHEAFIKKAAEEFKNSYRLVGSKITESSSSKDLPASSKFTQSSSSKELPASSQPRKQRDEEQKEMEPSKKQRVGLTEAERAQKVHEEEQAKKLESRIAGSKFMQQEREFEEEHLERREKAFAAKAAAKPAPKAAVEPPIPPKGVAAPKAPQKEKMKDPKQIEGEEKRVRHAEAVEKRRDLAQRGARAQRVQAQRKEDEPLPPVPPIGVAAPIAPRRGPRKGFKEREVGEEKRARHASAVEDRIKLRGQRRQRFRDEEGKHDDDIEQKDEEGQMLDDPHLPPPPAPRVPPAPRGPRAGPKDRPKPRPKIAPKAAMDRFDQARARPQVAVQAPAPAPAAPIADHVNARMPPPLQRGVVTKPVAIGPAGQPYRGMPLVHGAMARAAKRKRMKHALTKGHGRITHKRAQKSCLL